VYELQDALDDQTDLLLKRCAQLDRAELLFKRLFWRLLKGQGPDQAYLDDVRDLLAKLEANRDPT
jgi:hypothetical protein